MSPTLSSKCHVLYHAGETALAMAVTVEAEGEANFISGVMAVLEHRALSSFYVFIY
jgi:hypothetical protein